MLGERLKGVAVVMPHHAGLSSELRGNIERLFRAREVRVLVATTTLAMGVNLPATRVIVNTLRIGPVMLSQTLYKQMVGRAGRTGLTARGDAFLLVKPERVDFGRRMQGDLRESLRSKLLQQDFLARALLGVLAPIADNPWGVGNVESSEILALFATDFTLLGRQRQPAEVAAAVAAALNDLQARGMITDSPGPDGGACFRATPLGCAAFAAAMRITDAESLHTMLDSAQREGVVTVDLFHLLCLSVPFEGLPDPDLGEFASRLCDFAPERRAVAERIGVLRGPVERMAAAGRLCVASCSQRQGAAIRRVWAALALQDVANEVPPPPPAPPRSH